MAITPITAGQDPQALPGPGGAVKKPATPTPGAPTMATPTASTGAPPGVSALPMPPMPSIPTPTGTPAQALPTLNGPAANPVTTAQTPTSTTPAPTGNWGVPGAMPSAYMSANGTYTGDGSTQQYDAFQQARLGMQNPAVGKFQQDLAAAGFNPAQGIAGPGGIVGNKIAESTLPPALQQEYEQAYGLNGNSAATALNNAGGFRPFGVGGGGGSGSPLTGASKDIVNLMHGTLTRNGQTTAITAPNGVMLDPTGQTLATDPAIVAQGSNLVGGNPLQAAINATPAPSGSPGTPGAPSAGMPSAATGAPAAAASTGNPTLDGLLNGTATGAGSVNTSPLNPNQSLLGQVISPGALTNPVDMAKAAWNTFSQSTDPTYQASLRDAAREAAATGSLGSGMLNTNLGSLAAQRTNQLQTAQQQLMESALGQANQNAYQNVGIAQQQQGFQNQLQQEAFNNGLQQAEFGSMGDPTQLLMGLAQLYGGQAGQAGQGVNSLIQNTTMANAMQNNPLLQYYYQMMGQTPQGLATPSTGTTNTLNSLLNGLTFPQPSVTGG